MSAQVAADLRAAAEVLRREGWTQGTFHDEETGCHCAAGALEAVAERGITQRWVEAIRALAGQIGVVRSPISIYRWNDDPDRTADEVITTLEAAAAAAEA